MMANDEINAILNIEIAKVTRKKRWGDSYDYVSEKYEVMMY